MRELDYRPNQVARNLRARATSTIGVVIPDIQNPFFTSLVRGIEDALQAEKFTLLLANSDGDSARERVCLDTLCAEEVAGLLFVPCNAEPRAYDHLVQTGRARRRGRPIAGRAQRRSRRRHQRGRGARGRPAPGADLAGTASRSSAGHCRPTSPSSASRDIVARWTMAGLPSSASLVERADFREEGGYQAMVNLLRVSPRPTAVFVANNLMAMGALRAISDAGLRVPDDIALVLFDDIPWGARVNPPLTAVVQPTYDLGVSAARILLDRILEPHRPVRRVALQTTLIVRASCGAGLPGRTRSDS